MATPPDELALLVEALRDADAAYGSRIQPDGTDMRKSQPRLAARPRQGLPPAGVRLGGRARSRTRSAGSRASAARSRTTCSPASWSPASCSTSRSSTSSGGAATGTPWCPSAGRTAAARGCTRARAWPLRVAWDLFRIPLLHRGVRRAARRDDRSARPADRGGPAQRGAPCDRPARRSSRSRSSPWHVGATLAVAGDTLGYDFRAYHDAAVAPAGRRAAVRHVLSRSPARFGLFYYPPTVRAARAAVRAAAGRRRPPGPGSRCCSPPFATGGRRPAGARAHAAGWSCCWPGCSWPFLYSVKLGQVGPLLFLLFAIGWRWLDRPVVLGVTARAGRGDQGPAGARARPGRCCTRRWTAVAVGGRRPRGRWRSSATLVAGGSARGRTSCVLMGRVSDPITTPHNFTPGAVAYQLGVLAGRRRR